MTRTPHPFFMRIGRHRTKIAGNFGRALEVLDKYQEGFTEWLEERERRKALEAAAEAVRLEAEVAAAKKKGVTPGEPPDATPRPAVPAAAAPVPALAPPRLTLPERPA